MFISGQFSHGDFNQYYLAAWSNWLHEWPDWNTCFDLDNFYDML